MQRFETASTSLVLRNILCLISMAIKRRSQLIYYYRSDIKHKLRTHNKIHTSQHKYSNITRIQLNIVGESAHHLCLKI